MIKEYGIKDWNSFVQTICEIANHQEYRMWYRGQADYEWGLIPSVQQPEYHKREMSNIWQPILRYMIRSADLIKS